MAYVLIGIAGVCFGTGIGLVLGAIITAQSYDVADDVVERLQSRMPARRP